MTDHAVHVVPCCGRLVTLSIGSTHPSVCPTQQLEIPISANPTTIGALFCYSGSSEIMQALWATYVVPRVGLGAFWDTPTSFPGRLS